MNQQYLRRQRQPARNNADYEPGQRTRSSRQGRFSNYRMRNEVPDSFASLPAAPKDLWVCPQCNAENVDWLDFCPICGAAKPQ